MIQQLGSAAEFDVVLVGGGLSAGLIAMALHKWRPDVRVAIIEGGPVFGGNHTWSSFESDLSARGRELVAPLIAHRWPRYQVHFPAYQRELASPYQSAVSDNLHNYLMQILPENARYLGVQVHEVSGSGVVLADGRVINAKAVLDARGQKSSPHLELGFQKFVGLEVKLQADHGLTAPIIMDATVDQRDGYRFVYTLPFGPDRLLVEDTYYADGPELDRDAIVQRLRDYVAAKGWKIRQIIREEDGVLPIAIGGDIQAHLAQFPSDVAPVGMSAALFHPVTGYSFPDAVRMALHIADQPDLSGKSLAAAAREHAVAHWQSGSFYRVLNKMLFRAAFPDERRRILQRFYGLDEGLVARFYAGQNRFADKARILTGRPPIPVVRAIQGILNLPISGKHG